MYRHEDYNLTGTCQPERINGFMISAQFFPTLGVRPALGRDFNPDDDRLGAAPVALLSDGFWHRRFGGSPGDSRKSHRPQRHRLHRRRHPPPSFLFYGIDRDVYTPIGQWSDPSLRDRRVDRAPTPSAASNPALPCSRPAPTWTPSPTISPSRIPKRTRDVGIALYSMKEDIVGNVQPFLIVLLAAVGFLLLIACANVASLLLARSMSRSGEFAIRSALGASRTRIIRQLLTESTLLAGLGGALGFLLAFFGTKATINVLPGALPRSGEVSLDARVLLFTLAVSLAAGIVFGLAPALKTSRANLRQILRQSGRGASGARHRLQGIFVAAEVAMALVLLVGAGLMLRSLAALWRVNPGYDPSHAITFSVSLPSNSKTTAAETRARLRRFDAAMRAIPGVQAVSVTLGSRPMIHDSELPFWIEGRPKPDNDNDMPQAMFYLVESGFQPAMGITLERGRFVSDQDNENAPTVVDIDDVFARAYFAGQNPVGQHIHIAEFDKEAEIVGVVGHVRQWGPGNDPKTAIEAQFYYPFMQLPAKLMPLVADGVAVVIRTQDDPQAIMGPVRSAASAVDPGEVIYAVETMHGVIENAFAARRLSMILLAFFAAVALALSCIGIYGVISYLVGERTREIGVRMALGAQRSDVLRLILRQGATMALVGVALGIVLALGLTRLMSAQLFGVTAHDPLTFAAVGVILIVVALVACWLPARRAASVDPIVALHAE